MREFRRFLALPGPRRHLVLRVAARERHSAPA